MTDDLTIRMVKRFCEAKRKSPGYSTCIDMGEETFAKQLLSGRCNCPDLARDAINDMLRTIPQPSEGLGK